VAVVTNVEMDHHTRWGSLAELQGAFMRFAAPAQRLVTSSNEDVSTLAWLAEEPVLFDADSPGPADLGLAVPGDHNRRNARAALAAIEAAGFELGPAAAALAGFRGVNRRLELKGSRGPVHIYDDYAHHPTEVRAALSALRELNPSRLIAVFQPHLYSRTKALAEEFGAALTLADEVVVLDVYPAREEPVGELAGVSGLQVAQAAAERIGGRPVWWLPERETAERALADLLDHAPEDGEGAVLVTIGAGDVFKLGEALVTAPTRAGETAQ
jgi:UDP-N-acetylmuramate--alanine ligase